MPVLTFFFLFFFLKKKEDLRQALTTQHGQRWRDHPICQGNGDSEAQQMYAEGLCTGLLSGHAWSSWWRGGNAATGLFGAGEGGGPRVNHGGENDEREEKEEDVDVDLGSP